MGCGASSDAGSASVPAELHKTSLKAQPAPPASAKAKEADPEPLFALARQASHTAPGSTKVSFTAPKAEAAPPRQPTLPGELGPEAQSVQRRLAGLIKKSTERLGGMVVQFDEEDKGYLSEGELQVEFIKFFLEGTEPEDEDVDAVAAAMMATVPDGRITVAALLAGGPLVASKGIPAASVRTLDDTAEDAAKASTIVVKQDSAQETHRASPVPTPKPSTPPPAAAMAEAVAAPEHTAMEPHHVKDLPMQSATAAEAPMEVEVEALPHAEAPMEADALLVHGEEEGEEHQASEPMEVFALEREVGEEQHHAVHSEEQEQHHAVQEEEQRHVVHAEPSSALSVPAGEEEEGAVELEAPPAAYEPEEEEDRDGAAISAGGAAEADEAVHNVLLVPLALAADDEFAAAAAFEVAAIAEEQEEGYEVETAPENEAE